MLRFWLGAVAVAVLAGAMVGASFGSTATPRIVSITFGGSAASPRFVIHGGNLGRRPVSVQPPQSSSACRQDHAPGNQGLNYGDKLFFIDNSNRFSGGLSGPYKGVQNVVDCVGLIVTSYTPTRVAFSLGSDYTKHPYSIRQGDQMLFVVAGAKTTVPVRYGQTVK